MNVVVSLEEAEAQFDNLVRLVESGRTVVITRSGEVSMTWHPIEPASSTPRQDQDGHD
jgi:antitoxin (DNA-binding transcriptional repressor) of toxin-antitoxin stability system